MTFESSNTKDIEALETPELVKRVRTAMDQGCIHPCHVYDMVDEALQRLTLLVDDNEQLRKDCRELRKGMVAKCRCRHFRGLHENDYSDCLVVCGIHDDDYVSMAACQNCKDYELSESDTAKEDSKCF